MAFRADEAARVKREEAEAYLVPGPREMGETDRLRAKEAFAGIVEELGPVVDAYPTWHPLVCNHDSRTPVTTPSEECGYKGLDHTVFFAKGFITCPYVSGKSVIESVDMLPKHPVATITANQLDAAFYATGTAPILVRCDWDGVLDAEGMIPLRVAIPLILEMELPCWRWADFADTWETMRPYFIGRPHGSRSSLFVSQETGQGIKKVWETLIHTGMFGPIKV